MPSLSACCLTWVSLTLDVGYLLMAAAPDLGCGVTLHSFSSKAQPRYVKFAGILSAALSQHHLLGFEIAQLEFHLHIKVRETQVRW